MRNISYRITRGCTLGSVRTLVRCVHFIYIYRFVRYRCKVCADTCAFTQGTSPSNVISAIKALYRTTICKIICLLTPEISRTRARSVCLLYWWTRLFSLFVFHIIKYMIFLVPSNDEDKWVRTGLYQKTLRYGLVRPHVWRWMAVYTVY